MQFFDSHWVWKKKKTFYSFVYMLFWWLSLCLHNTMYIHIFIMFHAVDHLYNCIYSIFCTVLQKGWTVLVCKSYITYNFIVLGNHGDVSHLREIFFKATINNCSHWKLEWPQHAPVTSYMYKVCIQWYSCH